MTEQEMREADVPRLKSDKELLAYIRALVDQQHDYGTCVYAMSMAATAAFNYAASKVGATGFQAACADMDILRRTRHYAGPFMVVDMSQALYPQYDLPAKLGEFMDECKPWLREQAAKKLEAERVAHPDVLAHWKKLAEDA